MLTAGRGPNRSVTFLLGMLLLSILPLLSRIKGTTPYSSHSGLNDAALCQRVLAHFIVWQRSSSPRHSPPPRRALSHTSAVLYQPAPVATAAPYYLSRLTAAAAAVAGAPHAQLQHLEDEMSKENEGGASVSAPAAAGDAAPTEAQNKVVLRYVTGLLRDIFKSSSRGTAPVGLSLEEVYKRLQSAYGVQKYIPSMSMFLPNLTPELRQASLEAASDCYYAVADVTANPSGLTLYGYPWRALLTHVAARLPYEGVAEPQLLARLQEAVEEASIQVSASAAHGTPNPSPLALRRKVQDLLPPCCAALYSNVFSPASELTRRPESDRLGFWLNQSFPELLLVTRSVRCPSALIYYPAAHPSVLKPYTKPLLPQVHRQDGEVRHHTAHIPEDLSEQEKSDRELIQRLYMALGTLERDRLPVWTSFEQVLLPVLASRAGGAMPPLATEEAQASLESWYERLRTSPVLQQHFALKPSVLVENPTAEDEVASSASHPGTTPTRPTTMLLVDTLSLFMQKKGNGIGPATVEKVPEVLEKALQRATSSSGSAGKIVLILLAANAASSTEADLASAQQRCLQDLQVVLGAETFDALLGVHTDTHRETVMVPVDELVDAHHVVAALLERLSQGQSVIASSTGGQLAQRTGDKAAHLSSASAPSPLTDIVVVCADSVVRDMESSIQSILTAVAGHHEQKGSLLTAVKQVVLLTPEREQRSERPVWRAVKPIWCDFGSCRTEPELLQRPTEHSNNEEQTQITTGEIHLHKGERIASARFEEHIRLPVCFIATISLLGRGLHQMETLTQLLESLTTESRELLLQCMEACVREVTSGAVRPSQAALVLAQRFTEDNLPRCYPSLCLMDLMLLRCSSRQEGSPPAVLALRSILRELWPLLKNAPGILDGYATAIEKKPMRDKGIRLVTRWKQRNLLWQATGHDTEGAPATAGEKRRQEEEKAALSAVLDVILAKMEGKYCPEEGSGSTSTSPQEEKAPTGGTRQNAAGADASPSVPDTGSANGRHRTSTSSSPGPLWRKKELRRFRFALQACLQMLESLPIARAQVYADLLLNKRLRTPTPTAFAFLQHLRGALKAEVEKDKTREANEAEGSTGRQAAQQASATIEKDTNKRREALAQLLETLQESSATTRAGDDGVLYGTRVSRYAHPLLSDTCLRVPLSQRGQAGYGELLRRQRHPSAATRDAGGFYYPSAGVPPPFRPFRIPAAVLQTAPGGRGRRLYFPTESAWQAERDTAQLAMYDRRTQQGTALLPTVPTDLLGAKRCRESDTMFFIFGGLAHSLLFQWMLCVFCYFFFFFFFFWLCVFFLLSSVEFLVVVFYYPPTSLVLILILLKKIIRVNLTSMQ
eukprot:gene9980-6964_t